MYKKIFLKIIIVALLVTLPFGALAAGKTNSAKKATKTKAKQSAKMTAKSSATSKKLVCSANIYNCKDFSTQKAAQKVYEACLAQVGKDVHDLDRDKDGRACEENK